ncbi:MAG: glutathione S-transferase family protein [Acidobacteriota bacterium]
MQLYNAGLSTCSIKVRLALAEKELEVEHHWVDLRKGEQFTPQYLALNPQAVVPTLVDGETVVVESTLINEYLDDRFPEKSLRPQTAAGAYRMRRFTRELDVSLHPACTVVTYAVAMRPMQQRLPREQVMASIEQLRDPTKREQRREIYSQGVDAPVFAPALRRYVAYLDAMDDALAEGPWLAGESFSQADCGALPYVLRLEHVCLEELWSNGQRERVGDWYRRMRERPSWEIAVQPFLDERAVAAFRSAGEAVHEPMRLILEEHVR